VGGGSDGGDGQGRPAYTDSDPNVRVVFINIFGGILRCDTLAKGVTEAAGNSISRRLSLSGWRDKCRAGAADPCGIGPRFQRGEAV